MAAASETFKSLNLYLPEHLTEECLKSRDTVSQILLRYLTRLTLGVVDIKIVEAE